jgi:hypothetical protein
LHSVTAVRRRLRSAEEGLWKSWGAATPRGVSILSFENDKHIERRRKSVQASDTRTAREQSSKKGKGGSGTEFGSALRSVYQRTINEDIPPDLLDLLGKLG